MARDEWKTIALRGDIYDRLSALAAELERPVNWTANRIVERSVDLCMKERGDGVHFDPQTAEELGLR
jgi:hypothetical protein